MTATSFPISSMASFLSLSLSSRFVSIVSLSDLFYLSFLPVNFNFSISHLLTLIAWASLSSSLI